MRLHVGPGVVGRGGQAQLAGGEWAPQAAAVLVLVVVVAHGHVASLQAVCSVICCQLWLAELGCMFAPSAPQCCPLVLLATFFQPALPGLPAACTAAYELIPESGKVVLLDVDLPMRQAFHALHEQGAATAQRGQQG